MGLGSKLMKLTLAVTGFALAKRLKKKQTKKTLLRSSTVGFILQGFPIKGGMTIPNIGSLDPGTCGVGGHMKNN